ncbi:MAG: hypothetical protein ACD_67C00056G0005 [uncultured bacterium]|nr:MAG: hypothetical protein ACD_67C00056G0005 [uncultured bacterium]
MSEIGRISKVMEIFSYDELRSLVEKKKTVLFVGTDWCFQSRSMAVAIAELSVKFPEINFLVASLENNWHVPFSAKKEFKTVLGIEAYPTLLLFSENKIAPVKKVVSEKNLGEQKKDIIALVKRAE